jgi:hypothetical protein
MCSSVAQRVGTKCVLKRLFQGKAVFFLLLSFVRFLEKGFTWSDEKGCQGLLADGFFGRLNEKNM